MCMNTDTLMSMDIVINDNNDVPRGMAPGMI